MFFLLYTFDDAKQENGRGAGDADRAVQPQTITRVDFITP